MTPVTSSSTSPPTYHNVPPFLLTHVTFILSWSFSSSMFVILSCSRNFVIMIVVMILVHRLSLSPLASIFAIFIVSVITPLKITLSRRLYYPLLTFVSSLALSFFVVGCSFATASRIMGSCRVMWSIARLIIRVVMFITFVTLCVWISIRISMLLLIFITWHELTVPFLFLGCAGCSIVD